MSAETGECLKRERGKGVLYQSISLSDGEDETPPQEESRPVDPPAALEAAAPPPQQEEGTDREVEGGSLYTRLEELDDMCGQMNHGEKETGAEQGTETGPATRMEADAETALPAKRASEDVKDNDANTDTAGVEDKTFDTNTNISEGEDKIYENRSSLDTFGDSGNASDFVDSEENTVVVEVASYTCKLCSVGFRAQHQVENHLMVEHDLGEQTALFRVLKSAKKKKRVWRKEKDGYFHCLFCHHRSRRSINVRDHEKQKHKNEELPLKSYVCKLCHQRFALQDIFSHIQSQHESQSDSLTFIGNSLTEHYTVSFSTERKAIPPDGTAAAAAAQAYQSEYHYCQHCPYKTKSIRGLRFHERIQHPGSKVRKGQGVCDTCGEKKTINTLHTCKKTNKRGRKKLLTRNSEGHIMCADCPFTAKQYQSMYIHTKAHRHQVQRLQPVVKQAAPVIIVGDNGNSDDNVRVLRQRRQRKPEENTGLANEDDKDIAEGSTAAPRESGNESGETEGEGKGKKENGQKLEDDSENDWVAEMEGLMDSDTQESLAADSDEDPEWAPTGRALTPKKGRRSRRSSDSDTDPENGGYSRKRSASHDEGGPREKRRKYMEMPKDPNSPVPKRLPEGIFQCNFCEFQSKYMHSTEIHQWRHTGFKPFQCEVCERSFRQRPQLDKHKCTGPYDTDNTASTTSDGTGSSQPDNPITVTEDMLPSEGNAVPADKALPPSSTAESSEPDFSGGVTGSDNRKEQRAEDRGTNHCSRTEEVEGGSQSPMVVEKSTAEVTSPTPIVIAPPLGVDTTPIRHHHSDHHSSRMGDHHGDHQPSRMTGSQVIDLEDEDLDQGLQQVSNLDGNGDMPHARDPSQGMPNPMGGGDGGGVGGGGQVRMTSPTPLNIAPISSLGGVDHTQMPATMGGMGGFPEDPRFSMGNPPGMMDMSGANQMMQMPGMMPPGDPGMHHEQQFAGSYQQVDPNAMHPMPGQMGGMMGQVDVPPQFPSPDVGLLEHLNLMPNNNLMGSSGGYSMTSATSPITMQPTDTSMMPMTNEQYGVPQMPLFSNNNNPPPTCSSMIDLNQLETSTATQSPTNRFDMNPALCNTTDMSQSSAAGIAVDATAGAGRVFTEGTAAATTATTLGTLTPAAQSADPTSGGSVSQLQGQQQQQSEPEVTAEALTATTDTVPSAEVTAPRGTSDTASPLSQMNQMANAASGSSVQSPGPTPPPGEQDANQGSASERGEAPGVSTGSDPESSEGRGTATVTTDTAVVSVAASSDLSAVTTEVASVSGSASVSDAVPETSESVTASTAGSSASAASTTVTTVTGTTPTAVPQPAPAPAKATATNEAGKSINDLFKCILCRVYFEDQQMYRNHMVHHGGAIGTCRICGRMFRTPLLFMSHLHCSAQCKGVSVPAPLTHFPVTSSSTRGRGRGSRGGSAHRIAQPQTTYPHVTGSRGRGMRAGGGGGMSATPQAMTMPMASMNPGRVASAGRGSPLQAMRQMTPTTGRRGRPPLGSRQSASSYSPALMRQPLQQHQFSAQLQHMGALRAPSVRPVTSQRRRQEAARQDDVIVID